MFLHKLYKFKDTDTLEVIQEEAMKMIKMLGNWLCYSRQNELSGFSNSSMHFKVKFKSMHEADYHFFLKPHKNRQRNV
jgi:hypothetical protein